MYVLFYTVLITLTLMEPKNLVIVTTSFSRTGLSGLHSVRERTESLKGFFLYIK